MPPDYVRYVISRAAINMRRSRYIDIVFLRPPGVFDRISTRQRWQFKILPALYPTILVHRPPPLRDSV